MFGELPAYGFFLRHVKGIELNNVEVSYLKEDMRPAFVLDDVKGVGFSQVTAQQPANVPTFVLKNVADFSADGCKGVPDTHLDKVDQKRF